MRDHDWPAGKDYYTTRELREHGFSEYVLTRLVREGKLSRIVRGIYTRAAVTGRLVLEAVNEHKPHLVFSGKTVAELYLGKEISLPLHAVVERGRSTAQSSVVRVRERRKVDVRMIANVRMVSALVAAGDATAVETARELLEVRYASKKGREDFERDRQALVRLPEKTARMVAAAAVGADSWTERRLFRELQARGCGGFEGNAQLGPYRFDGVDHQARVVVEVNGFKYHGAHNRKNYTKDVWKLNAAQRRGYIVLWFTEHCVEWHLGTVVEMVMDTVKWRRETREGRAPATPMKVEETGLWRWHATFTHLEP